MRALVIGVALAAAVGCGGAAPASPPAKPEAAVGPGEQSATPPVDPRRAACDGDELGTSTSLGPPLPVDGKVVEIAIEGLARLDEAPLRASIHSPLGPLDPASVAGDIRRLWAHDGVEDVVVEAHPTHAYRDDLRLVYRITERPAVGEIFLEGDTAVARDLARRIEGGPLVEPRRVHGWAREVIDELHRRGHRRATLRVTAHPAASARLDLCIHADPGPQAKVARWAITGVTSIPQAELDPIYAHAQIGQRGVILDDEALALSLLHLQAAYWNHGHLESTISAPVITPAGDDQLEVAVEVEEGPVYRYGEVTVDGHAKAAYPRLVAPLKKGAVFRRREVMDVIEALRAYHAGNKLEVDVHTHLDRTAHTADLELRMVEPGAVTGTM